METNRLEAIFKPQSVAVIGASTIPGKLGHDILANLIRAGFEGPIYPVNPKAEEILALPAFKQISDTPSPPELAVIVIPARAVPHTLEQCGQAGVKAAIVITGGFAEAGPEGEQLQQQLTDIARRYGLRLLGPNCQGINHPYHQLCASWPLLTTKGRMALVSQSGTVGAALMDWANQEKLGVSSFVSLGNRADVDEADVIQYLNQDDNTQVIALYVEGVKRPVYFLDALAEATKPLVILKAGRTEKGRQAAESHTKSLAGTDAVYDAIFRKYRVHRADSLEELYDYAKGLAYLPKPKGRRLLNISSSGGAAILAIDQAEKLGFKVPEPSPALKDQLASFLPPHCVIGNPVDLTGDVISNAELYKQVIDAAQAEYDTMVVIFGDPIPRASQVVTPGAAELVVFLGGADIERQEVPLIQGQGIPVFPTPERGIKALHQFFRFESAAPAMPAPTPPPTGHRLLPAAEAGQLLARYGIPAAAAPLATSPEEAVQLAQGFGFPVAVKIASPDLPHKSDVGGVRLHLATAEEVNYAYQDILATVHLNARKAQVDGVTVSPMAKPGGLEVIIGMNCDPQYGPILMFGLGGIFTEIYRDVQFSLLSNQEEDYRRMIRGITGYPLLAGARGQRPKDEEALIQVLKGVARLAQGHPEFDQIDLNPVLVYERGVFVVDVRIFSCITT